VRNKLELNIPAFKQAAAAIQNQLIPEATEEPCFDDELFKQVDELTAQLAGEELEDTHELNDEGEEELKRKYVPLYAQLGNMTISQKIRRATLGTGPERMLLVRDRNRLVATAAAQSPMLKENEATLIASSRSVIDDVLRIIAQNKGLHPPAPGKVKPGQQSPDTVLFFLASGSAAPRQRSEIAEQEQECFGCHSDGGAASSSTARKRTS
jgi:hypothetical protein